MYRIQHIDGHPIARGVCHECKKQETAHIWWPQGDGYQVTPPTGWATFLDGRMQRLRCKVCSEKSA